MRTFVILSLTKAEFPKVTWPSVWSWESEIKVSARLISSEASLFVLQMATLSLVLTQSFLSACDPGVSLYGQITSSYKDSS